jgi:hypothetical protein
MLDSLLQSRQLHESIYRLEAVPAEAMPTSNSTVLQHHQHPYFMQHYEEFIPEGVTSNAHSGSAAQQLQAALMNRAQKATKMEAPPKLEPIPELVPRLRGATFVTNPSAAARSLFRGMRFVFAGDELADDATPAIEAHGGKVLKGPGSLQAATHVVFTSADKKSDTMLGAVEELQRRADGGLAALTLVASNWLLDAMFLESAPPALGPYTATEKLLATLAKRLSKRGGAKGDVGTMDI